METPEEISLPEGWIWTTLGDIISVHSGKGLTAYQMEQSGKYPVYGGNGINGFHNKFIFEESKLIIGRVGAKCGIVHTTLPKCWITDNALIVDFWLIHIKFLYYMLNNLNLNRFSVSTAQPVISSRKIYPLFFGLPPLSEQHRIVARIEQLFTNLDAGVESLKAARTQLKRYRQSVLKSACEGRLVPTEAELVRAEGRDYEPAEVLLERILEERRRKWEVTNGGKKKYKEPVAPDINGVPELPNAWKKVSIDQISYFVTDGDHNPPKRINSGIPHLTAKNINNWQISEERCTYISDKDFERVRRRYEPLGGDVLITCVGTIGRTAIVPNNYIFSADRNLAVVRLVADGMNETFFLFALNAPSSQKKMNTASGSTAQPHFYLGDIRPFSIPLPPLAEQHRIVAEVERRLSVADEMEMTINQSLKQAQRLRQSILKRAFEGKLVPQDPEDEPAWVLLERIKEEKAQREKVKVKRKVKRTIE